MTRGIGIDGNRGDYGGTDDNEEMGYDETTLDWIEVTNTGDILGPQAFRAKQLGLGINTHNTPY